MLAVGALLAPLPPSLRNFGISMALLCAFAAPNAWVSQKADKGAAWRTRPGLAEFLTLLPLFLGVAYFLGTLAASRQGVETLHNLMQFFTVSVVYTVLSTPILARLAGGEKEPFRLKQAAKRDTRLALLAITVTTGFVAGWYAAFFMAIQRPRLSQTWETAILVGQMMAHMMLLALVTSLVLAAPSWKGIWRACWWRRLWLALSADGPVVWKRVRNAMIVALLYRMGSLLIGSIGSGTLGVLLVELTGNILYLPITYVMARKQ